MMHSLRNFLGMVVDDDDELFVSQMVFPNFRCMAEAALAGRRIDTTTLSLVER